MKICLISGAYPPVHCGVGEYTASLAQGLAEAGEEVMVLTSQGIPAQTQGIVQVEPLVSSWHLPSLWLLRQAIKKYQPQIVHLQYPATGYGKGLAPNLLFSLLSLSDRASKRVLTLHEYQTYTFRGRGRLTAAIRSSHLIISTNQEDRQALLDHEPSCLMRLRQIPLGSSMASLPTGPAAAPGRGAVLPDNLRAWLLYFGQIMPNKGWEQLLPALRRLLDQGRKLGLLAVAELLPESHEYHREIQKLIRQYQLENAIHFTGYLDQPAAARFFQACPIAVLPFTEGLSLRRSSFISLLAHGRAIVTVDPLCMLEEVRHGTSFWGVIPHDPAALAAGISHLLDHPELVSQLQQGALQAAKQFAWTRIVKLHRSLYQQVING